MPVCLRFIERDLKQVLPGFGFGDFKEYLCFHNYGRLMWWCIKFYNLSVETFQISTQTIEIRQKTYLCLLKNKVMNHCCCNGASCCQLFLFNT